MNKKREVTEEELKLIKKQIESIQYGNVSIIVQDGKMIQIETNEKIRLI